MTSRVSWFEYFMSIAHVVATRATCDRKHVGCVIVRDKRIIATGYNGSVPGMPHCDDVGHDMQGMICKGCRIPMPAEKLNGCDGVWDRAHEAAGGNCVRTVHAEANAIAQAARAGISLQGSEIYTNTFPCWPCFRLLVSAGIVRVYYDDEYLVDERVAECAAKCGIMMTRLSKGELA